jgi:hypothetical protein
MKNRYEAVITLTVSYKAAEGDERRQLGYIEDALITRRLGLPSSPTIKHLESGAEIDCMEEDV